MKMSNIKDWCKINYTKSPYLKYSRNIFTQNGEDGIIEKLFQDLGITNGTVVEFGAWDGIYISNIYKLWRYLNYDALLIECDHVRVNELDGVATKFSNIEVVEAMVSPDKNSPNSLDNILSRSRLDYSDDNFSLLSIDVDSVDYQIWDSLEKFRPKVVIIESNYKYKDAFYVGNDGSSLKSLIKLGESKGYKLVCYNLNGFFVRNDLFEKLNMEPGTYETMYVDINDICNVLQRVDEDGNFKSTYRYRTDEYWEIIIKEKRNW
jgi:hypothetical protein